MYVALLLALSCLDGGCRSAPSHNEDVLIDCYSRGRRLSPEQSLEMIRGSDLGLTAEHFTAAQPIQVAASHIGLDMYNDLCTGRKKLNERNQNIVLDMS